MKKIIALLFCLIFLINMGIKAQNLIENPGFESGPTPSSEGAIGQGSITSPHAWGWNTAVAYSAIGSGASPDLFDLASPNCEISIPNNKWGDRPSNQSGTRYAGFSVTEPIMGSFTSGTLSSGCYDFSFYASRVDGYHMNCSGTPDPLSSQAEFELKVFLGNGSNTGTHQEIFSGNSSATNWTQFSSNFEIPSSSDNLFTNIIFRLEVGSIIIYLDDVYLEQITTVGPAGTGNELIENITYSGTENIFACQNLLAGYNVGHPGPDGNVIVQSGATVEYSAAERVLLKPGFSVKSNGNFHAFIQEGCNCVEDFSNDCDGIYYDPNGLLSELTYVALPGPTFAVTGTFTPISPYIYMSFSISEVDAWLSHNLVPNTFPTTLSSWQSSYTTGAIDFTPFVFEEGKIYKITHTVWSDFDCIDLNQDRWVTGNSAWIDNTVGVEPVLNNTISETKIYPNPNNGQFNITIESNGVTLIEVYDLRGKQVFSGLNSQRKKVIDISAQPKGIYLVRITIDDQVFSKKIIYQ